MLNKYSFSVIMIGLVFIANYGHCMNVFDVVRDGDKQNLVSLINKGIDINLSDKYGWTPLFIAVNKCDSDLTMVLLNNGANLDLKDSYGYGVFHYVCSSNQNMENKEAILNLLRKERYKKFENMNFDDEDNELIKAINSNILLEVKKLVKDGINPNVTGKYNWTPLMHSVSLCRADITKYLLENGAKVKSCTEYSVDDVICVRSESYVESDLVNIESMLEQSRSGKTQIDDLSRFKTVPPGGGKIELP